MAAAEAGLGRAGREGGGRKEVVAAAWRGSGAGADPGAAPCTTLRRGAGREGGEGAGRLGSGGFEAKAEPVIKDTRFVIEGTGGEKEDGEGEGEDSEEGRRLGLACVGQ